MRLWWLLPCCMALAGCQTAATRGGEPGSVNDLSLESAESPANLYIKLALAYIREGQYNTALGNLRKAMDADSGNPQVYNVTALLYQRLGEYSLADEYFARAVELKPRDPYIRNARGTYFCDRQRYAEADAEFQLAAENTLYPTPWIALTNAGICAQKAGNPTQAEEYLRKALQSNPQWPTALAQMVQLQAQQKNVQMARSYAQRYLQLHGPNPVVLRTAVEVEEALGNRQDAARYLRQMRELYPDSEELQWLKNRQGKANP